VVLDEDYRHACFFDNREAKEHRSQYPIASCNTAYVVPATDGRIATVVNFHIPDYDPSERLFLCPWLD
jgi:hypothetical protein